MRLRRKKSQRRMKLGKQLQDNHKRLIELKYEFTNYHNYVNMFSFGFVVLYYESLVNTLSYQLKIVL